MTHAGCLAPGTIFLAIAANAAIAQAPVTERGDLIEEIIVTAQKRENPARKVPISLYAESGRYLRQAGIDSVGALGNLAAGVELVSQHTGKLQMAIRGVTNLSNAAQDSTAAVGYYVDETPLSSFRPREMPDMALWDIERVEILRGPQGTLFGESSMGGTIRVMTRKPDPSEFSGGVVGSWETVADGGAGYGLRAMLNAPLISDELALRINLSTSDVSGSVDIPDLGIEDANDADQKSLRLALGWTPNDNIDLQLSYIDQSIDLDSNSWATARGVLLPQNEEPLGLWDPIRGLSPQENQFQLLNLTIKYDFERAAFVSATSYFDSEQHVLDDFSFYTPAILGVPGSFTEEHDLPTDSLTQEFRLSSNNEALNWTVGAFFKRNQRGGGEVIEIDAPDIGLLDVARLQYDIEIDSYALFGEVDYKLSERWAVQAGGRYYSDDRTNARTQVTSSVVWALLAGTTTEDSASDNDFAPSIGVSWTGEQKLFFVRTAKGFRAGGNNLAAEFVPDEVPSQFKAEELWTYETGIKNRLWDNRLQLNAYVYFNRWDSIQVGQMTESLYRYTSNAGEAEALGTEVEFTVQATDKLMLGAFLALVDTEMTETILDSLGGVIVEKGNGIPLIPKTKLSLLARYSWPMTANLDATAFGRWVYRSETHSSVSNVPVASNDSYNLAYVRFGLEGASWATYLSVDNLFDEKATVFRQSPEPFPLAFSTYVQPRTVRLELQWDF
jgi:outer membrane receptor protein involved in Fe transport